MVDPLIQTIEALDTSRVAATAWAAYDAALIVVAEKLAGPGGRHMEIDRAWQELLPALAPLVAQAPTRVIGAVTNALCRLASSPSTRAAEWVDRLLALAPQLDTLETLLGAGQVAAWRCGLAQYRKGALTAADALPPTVALRLLDAPENADWSTIRTRLAKERWWNPAQDFTPQPLQIVRTAGTFRGFGGLFVEPPFVAAQDEHIFARAGGLCWLLTADAFGATFHRATPEEFAAASAGRSATVRFANTSLTVDGKTRDLPALGTITTAAATSDTVAVTGLLTHSITLLAKN
jgi:hypothetical protein